MFKRYLYPVFQWFYGTVLDVWFYLSRPFRHRSYTTELPLASPVVPSTPSFIQSQEPNFNLDAMRVFQFNKSAAASASHLARNRLAVQQMRYEPSNVNRITSLTSTDPSPGFSLLNDVVDNLVTSDCNSPSLYSSPPSSPSSSLDTPYIVISNPIGDIALNDDFIDSRAQRQPQISPLGLTFQADSHPPHFRPEVQGLGKRRNFKGAPIVTKFSRETLIPIARVRNCRPQQSLIRPKSAFAAVTDFVRASTNLPPRTASRDTFVISPESQAAFNENSPFSVQSESFFIDDHLRPPPKLDIQDLGIYTDTGSELISQVRDCAIEPFHGSFYPTIGKNGKISHSEGVRACRRAVSFSATIGTSRSKARTLSDICHPTAMSSAGVLGDFVIPNPSCALHVHPTDSPGISIPERAALGNRLSLNASLIFPFSLEDSISLGDRRNSQLALNHDSIMPFKSVSHLYDSASVDIISAPECGSLTPGTTPPSVSDYRFDSPTTSLSDGVGDLQNNSTLASHFGKFSAFFSSPVVDQISVAGSATLSSLATRTDSESLLDAQNFYSEEKGTAMPFRQVTDLDDLFVSSGDHSLLLPVSESSICIRGSQSIYPAPKVVSIECRASVNDRRARRIGFYGPSLPPLVIPDAIDDVLPSELVISASEREKGSPRRSSRPGSALRPLVLPMRVAMRELGGPSTEDHSFDKGPDARPQSNRSSIGLPPSYPLPDLPLYDPSIASTIVVPGLSGLDLEALRRRKSVSNRSRPSLSTPAMPNSDDSANAVNWGVAF